MANSTEFPHMEDFRLPNRDGEIQPMSNGSQISPGYEITDTEKQILIPILCVFSVVGTLGNGFAIYIFTKDNTIKPLTSTIFILALAWTDFLTCLVTIPYTVVRIYLNSYLKYDILCKIYFFLLRFTVPLSVFIMVAIAVDRYICICHPFSKSMTVTRAKIIVGVLAAISTILAVLEALSFSVYHMVSDIIPNRPMAYFADRNAVNNSVNYSITVIELASDVNISLQNETTGNPTVNKEIYTGQCHPSYVLLSPTFIKTHNYIYLAIYPFSFLIVVIFYGLIYIFVTKQRAKRRMRKMESLENLVDIQIKSNASKNSPIQGLNVKHSTRADDTNVNTITTAKREKETVQRNIVDRQDNDTSSCTNIQKNLLQREMKKRKDQDTLANIKTAFMLFIVTAVFIVAYLSTWLMALDILDVNIVVFHLYFIHHVSNPVIYAFMNKLFQDNMFKMIRNCRLQFYPN